MKDVLGFAFIASLAVAAPAMGQSQAQPQAQPQPQQAAATAGSADEVVCEREQEIGSRLSSHKICHTRSQWQQLRLSDRSATEHVQSQRTMDGNGH